MTDIVQGHGFGLDEQMNRFLSNKYKDTFPNQNNQFMESIKESKQKMLAQINDISNPEMKSAMMERMGAKPLDVSLASLFQRMKTDPLMHKDTAFPDSGEIRNPWLKKYDKIQSKLSGLLGPNGEPLTLQERQIMDYKNKYSTFMQPTVQKHGMLGASGNVGQLQALQSPAIQEQTQQFLEQSKAVKNTTDTHKEHGNGLKNLLTRYFGITAIIHLAKRAFQEMLKQIKENSAAFRTFERNMANVSTIVGDTKENMGSLTAGVALMSKTFGKDANDVAKGLYDILSAAVKVEDSLQLLYISGKAAVAGLTDMKTAVNVMVSVMNSYGYSVNQMAHASDVLFAGVVRGVFTFEQFESSLGYLIPIAAQVGISLEEIIAAVSTATRFGQHIDSVTRGLALSIQNIINPSQKAAKAAEKLGIDLSELGLSSKGLIGFFADLKEKVDGSNSILSDIIPNMRSFRVAMILAGTGAGGAALDFDIMNSSVDATDVAFNKVAATVAFTKDQITQYVAEVKRMVGETQVDLDFMGDKWDLFVTKLTGRFMKAFNPVDIGIGIATLGGSFLVGFEQTAIESSEMVDKVIKAGTARRKQAWEDQQEEYDLTDPFIEKETFYQQLMKGQDVDLSAFKDLKYLYDIQEEHMTDYGTFYNERRESILLKDKDMFIQSLEDEINYYKEHAPGGVDKNRLRRDMMNILHPCLRMVATLIVKPLDLVQVPQVYQKQKQKK
jgi:TP901 family phage tail tape measure protein